MNEPKIRLKGCDIHQSITTLGEIAKEYKVSNWNVHHQNLLSLSYGKIVKKNINSKKGLLPASFDTYQIIKKNIIVFRVTDLQNDKKSLRVAISKEDGIISPAYVCVECIDDRIDPDYLHLLLHYYDVIKKEYYNMGDGMRQTLKFKELQTLTIPYPDLHKQQEIVQYFNEIDSLIEMVHNKIEKLKSIKISNLQSMFPQEGETTPRIRFKGFEGEWEKVSLKKYAKRINRKNKNMESTLALTISSIDGLVSQIDYFNNLVVGANLANYYLLKNGEFAYNKSYSKGYPFGSVKRLDRYDQGILSTLYIVFSINDEISSDYLARFFDTTLWHKQVAERAEEGARNHGLLNIGADDFMTIDIVVPKSLDEQQKIADYFTNLDSQITLQTQLQEKLKQIKSACLDNMFV